MTSALTQNVKPSYVPRHHGVPNTSGHRIFIEQDGNIISVWHDISVYSGGSDPPGRVQMVVTSPRWTNARTEVATDEPLAPIRPTIRKGKPSYLRNVFPHHGHIWNCGIVPQTLVRHDETLGRGPADILDIGSQVSPAGTVKLVKILGALGVPDNDVIDWKLLAIDVRDERAGSVHDVADIEAGLLQATKEILQLHELPDGRGTVHRLVDEPCDSAFAVGLIHESHERWRELVSGNVLADGLDLTTTAISDSPGKVNAGDFDMNISSDSHPPAPIPSAVDKTFHIDIVH